MTNYQKFLEASGIISEESFNKVIESFPVLDVSSIDFFEMDESEDNVARCIIDHFLSNIGDGPLYSDDVNFENKTFTIYGTINSQEDLSEIKNIFAKWTINDYDDLVDQIEEDQSIKEIESLINKIRLCASVEQLRNFVNSL